MAALQRRLSSRDQQVDVELLLLICAEFLRIATIRLSTVRFSVSPPTDNNQRKSIFTVTRKSQPWPSDSTQRAFGSASALNSTGVGVANRPQNRNQRRHSPGLRNAAPIQRGGQQTHTCRALWQEIRMAGPNPNASSNGSSGTMTELISTDATRPRQLTKRWCNWIASRK